MCVCECVFVCVSVCVCVRVYISNLVAVFKLVADTHRRTNVVMNSNIGLVHSNPSIAITCSYSKRGGGN